MKLTPNAAGLLAMAVIGAIGVFVVPAVAETGPMCGCDNESYENAKAVHSANVAIKYAGKCKEE